MKTTLIMLATVVLLFACTAKAPPPQAHQPAEPAAPSDAVVSGAALAGTWKIVAVNRQPVREPAAVLLFDPAEQAFSATAGCNRMFGGYRAEQTRLRMESPATTLMACPGKAAVIELEARIAHAINQARSYRVDGRHLDLHDHTGQSVLRAAR